MCQFWVHLHLLVGWAYPAPVPPWCSMMAPSDAELLTILSWNVRGLNSKYKRSLLFHYLKPHNPHIVLLQETHLTGNKVLALKKPWVQRALHATYSSYSQGVSILISKRVPCLIHDVHLDPQGKYVMVVLSMYNKKYVIVNVYLPPSQIQILYTLYERLAPHCPAHALFMGDFNATLSRDLDRPSAQSTFNSDLGTWAQATDLQEAWRWLHPHDRMYSCFSTTFKTSSRIDLAFANAALLASIREAVTFPLASLTTTHLN